MPARSALLPTRPRPTADATHARADLDAAAAAVEAFTDAHHAVLVSLIRLWDTAAWRASGARSFRAWAATFTVLSPIEAARLDRLCSLCAAHPSVTEAILSGALTVGRADRLARVATGDRAPFLAGSLPALVDLAATTADDEAFFHAVAFWAEQVDQQLAVRPVHRHRLYLSQRLFGGGHIDGDLSPASFATVSAALDAWMQSPDSADAPYQRTFAERRADALDDLAHHALRSEPDQPFDDADETVAAAAADTFDGWHDHDELDARLADGSLDPLAALRARLASAETQPRRRQRRRTARRSAVRVNVHVDLQTLLGRDVGDVAGIVARHDHWPLASAALGRLTCDADLVATLFNGPGHVVDANDAAPRFSARQRAAIEARDGGCVFPGCRRPPRHCDIHHLEHRSRGGPTTVANGALLCSHHHDLLHAGWRLHRDPESPSTWVATDAAGHEWRTPSPMRT